MVGWPSQTGVRQTFPSTTFLNSNSSRRTNLQRQNTGDVWCSATTLSFGWVDRTGEVSSSGNGAKGDQLRQNRNSTSKLQQQQSRKKGGKAQQPPQQTRKQNETSSEQQSRPSVPNEAIKSAKTMQELSEALTSLNLSDSRVTIAAVLQLPHVLRNASGKKQRAAITSNPLLGILAKAALVAMPSAILQDLVAMTLALAELDEASADEACLQALSSAAGRLLGILSSSTPMPAHLLCQIVAAVAMSGTLQKDFRSLLRMSVSAVEAQLNKCRPQDLCILASELCNLGLYVQHAKLIRTAVDSAIAACKVIPPHDLAKLAHACGVIKNVSQPQMLELASRLDRMVCQMGTRDLIMVLQAFSVYRVSVPGLASRLAETLELHLSNLSPRRFSIALTALAKMGHRPQSTQSQHFLEELHRRLDKADARSQASLFWAVNRLGMRPSRALLDKASLVLQSKEIEAQITQKELLLTTRNLSSIIWAWGTFGYAPVAMPFLLEVAEARMQQCNDQDLANIMFGLASCDRPRLATPSLVKAAEQHACSIADSFSPQGLANTLWAFAKLEKRVPRFCEAASSKVVRRLSSFGLRDLSQILWALAKLEHRRSSAAVSAISNHSAAILKAEGPWTMRDVAQMTWSLGVLNQPELPFLEACQQAVSRRMSEASAVDVTNLMWGYASLNTPPSSPCMQMHAVRIGELVNELQADQLSIVLWSMGKLQAYPGIEVMETLVSRSRISLAEHAPQGISSMAQACAALRHHPGELLNAIIADVEARPSQYERNDWTNIVWALTRLGRDPGRLWALLADEINEGRISMDGKLMSTVIWSLALFRAFESPLYDDILRSLKQYDMREFDQESVRRLYQAYLLSGALRRKAAANLPPEFLMEGRRLWLNALDADAEPSSNLVDVSEALSRIGLENDRAPVIGRGTFKMDILLRQVDKDGHPVAIEIISPHKMTRNTCQPISRVLYRNACLKAWGYTIVPVLWHDWNAFGNSWKPEARSAKENHLLKLLTPVLHGEAVREKVLSTLSSEIVRMVS